MRPCGKKRLNNIIVFCYVLSSISFATRSGWPQQLEPIAVSPYWLTHPVNFPCWRNYPSSRSKPTTFGRALTCYVLSSISFATRAGSPQQREPITVGPYYLANIPCGRKPEYPDKPTTFARALIYAFFTCGLDSNHVEKTPMKIEPAALGVDNVLTASQGKVAWNLES